MAIGIVQINVVAYMLYKVHFSFVARMSIDTDIVCSLGYIICYPCADERIRIVSLVPVAHRAPVGYPWNGRPRPAKLHTRHMIRYESNEYNKRSRTYHSLM